MELVHIPYIEVSGFLTVYLKLRIFSALALTVLVLQTDSRPTHYSKLMENVKNSEKGGEIP